MKNMVQGKAPQMVIRSLCVLLSLSGGVCSGKVIYVDADAPGANNGQGWANAHRYLQDALAAASSGDVIWVAAGIYKPDKGIGFTSGDRAAAFRIRSSVKMYGGFAGTEDPSSFELANRDFSRSQTTVSGDIGTEGVSADNSHHVFFDPYSLNETAVLDGFVITGGNAPEWGGGMCNLESNPTIANCTFIANSAKYGGGLYQTGSTPTLTNCRFIGNSADRGGAIYTRHRTPRIINCTFSDNCARQGGGIYNEGGNPTIANCTFSGNRADFGGAVCNYAGGSIWANCTFSANSAEYDGGAVYNINSSPTFSNCVMWADSAVNSGSEVKNYQNSLPNIRSCDIAGCGVSGPGWRSVIGKDLGGNLDVNPLFTDPNSIDLRLGASSQCIDTGSNSAAPGGIATDLDGHNRFIDGNCDGQAIVDMGAYEFRPNRAPVLAPIGDKSVDENDLLSFTVSATDEDIEDIIVYSAIDLPSGAVFADRTFDWTPTYDQAGTYQVTFIASDGKAQDSETITITANDVDTGPADVLYRDDFNDGNFVGWKVVDDGTIYAPSNWSAVGGTMVQASNIYAGDGVAIDKPGTYAIYENGLSWTNYRVSLSMKSTDDDGIGVMLRYQDKNNYYRFSWDRQRSYRRIVKKQDGVFTVAAQDNVPYIMGQTYQVKFVACGPILQVFIDGDLIFQARDRALESGSIALYSWGNTGSFFDDVVVEQVSPFDFTETFDDCAGWEADWAIMDEGTAYAPSVWSCGSGQIVQSSNIYSGDGIAIDKPGTYALYKDGVCWSDYQVSLAMRSADDDAIGVMFRYQDDDNYYRFSWDRQRGYRRLVKKENGVFSLLTQDSATYVMGLSYHVEIIACGVALQVFIDGEPIFLVSDPALESGSIALYTWGNEGSAFDNLIVEGL